ncbi:uncharacterized protein LOC142885037 isoform X2 [Nelusetta ayraudi]|uniref:uncharacterized protein LOC142885037 isoform X2 n=1 Tax=Nelusetta ayraudi TaxID=303726 RepID=UPI003F6FC9CB
MFSWTEDEASARMCMSLKFLCSVMSLKGRRFSLDSYALQDASNGRKSVSVRGKRSKQSQCVDEGRQEIEELRNSLDSKESPSKSAAVEENPEHSDGLINSHSVIKHKKTFHSLFQEVPEEETVTHTFTCALQKDLLFHGKLFVSKNYLCFHSSMLLTVTKLVILVSSVREVKKHLLSVMNIKTADGEKHSFCSLRNRETCYNLLQTLCWHAQHGGSANSSPPLSSAENEVEHDVASSDYSLEDSLDPELDHNFASTSRESPEAHSFSHQSSSADEAGQASWGFWNFIERITSFFLAAPLRNVSPFLSLTVVLMTLLLLASGYLGLRMMALEAQLKSLGALTELLLHSREYQDT